MNSGQMLPILRPGGKTALGGILLVMGWTEREPITAQKLDGDSERLGETTSTGSSVAFEIECAEIKTNEAGDIKKI